MPRLFTLFYFLLPLPFLAVCLVMIALDDILGNVDPETLDRQMFVRVMQLRDFRHFSPELIERFTLRAEQEFGRHSPNPPVFELPGWEKRIHVRKQTQRSEQPSYMERNMGLMAKMRYFQWMHAHDAADRVQKAELMNDVVADMRHWQGVYLDYVRFLGLPEPTPAELFQDFQRMIEDFKADASPEEIALIDAFTQNLSRILFASEVQGVIRNFLPGLW